MLARRVAWCVHDVYCHMLIVGTVLLPSLSHPVTHGTARVHCQNLARHQLDLSVRAREYRDVSSLLPFWRGGQLCQYVAAFLWGLNSTIDLLNSLLRHQAQFMYLNIHTYNCITVGSNVIVLHQNLNVTMWVCAGSVNVSGWGAESESESESDCKYGLVPSAASELLSELSCDSSCQLQSQMMRTPWGTNLKPVVLTHRLNSLTCD